MKKNTKIVLRADGDSTIGLGHLYRMYSLYLILKDHCNVLFATKNPTQVLKLFPGLKDMIINLEISKSNDEPSLIVENNKDIKLVILDGYQFSIGSQKLFKKYFDKIILIDDFIREEYFIDLVIFPSHIDKELIPDYRNTKFISGIEYCFLRPAFLNYSRQREYGNKPIPENWSALIAMGGSDMGNTSYQVYCKLREISTSNRIHILIGSANLHQSFLESIDDVNLVLHYNIGEQELAGIMQVVDFAVCSASTVSYEYLSIGWNLFIIQTADNQVYAYSFLINSNMAVDFSNFDLYWSPAYETIRKFFNGNQSENIFKLINEFLNED